MTALPLSPETPEERLARVRAQARETPVQRLARVRAKAQETPEQRLARVRSGVLQDSEHLAATDRLSPNNRGRGREPVGEVTTLPADREAEFSQWVKRLNIRDLDHPDSHYDYRGAFLAGVGRDPASAHWPDTFKQHGHPTFSDQSQYAYPGDPLAGHWVGDTTYVPGPGVRRETPLSPSTTTPGQSAVARAVFEPLQSVNPAAQYEKPQFTPAQIQRRLPGGHMRGSEAIAQREGLTGQLGQMGADVENIARGVPGGVLNAATSTIRLPEQVVRAGIRAIKNVNNVVWVKADSPVGRLLGYTVDGPLPGNHPILSMLVGGVPETPVTDRALPVLGAAEQGVQRLLQPEGPGGVIGANIGMLGAFSAAPKLLGVPAEARVVPIENPSPFGQLTSDLAKTHEARGAPISPEVAPSTPEGEIAFPEPTAAERASVPSRPGLGGLADRLQSPEAPEPTIPPRMTDTEFARYQRETRQMEDRLTQQFADITAQATPATPETPVQRLERVRSGFVNRERIPAIEQLAQERHAARVAELQRIDAERVAETALRKQIETPPVSATEPATPVPLAPPPVGEPPQQVPPVRRPTSPTYDEAPGGMATSVIRSYAKRAGGVESTEIARQKGLNEGSASTHVGVKIKGQSWMTARFRTEADAQRFVDELKQSAAVGEPPVAPEAGFSTLPVLGGLAGAGGGALIGAQDKEHPLRGAIIGGVLGGIAGAFGTTKLEEHGPALRDSFRKIIAPSERTPEAQMTGRIIAAHAALAAQDFERAAYALENLRKVVKPLTTTEGRDFVANIEAGTPTNLPPELRAPVAAIRQALDSERDAIIGLGKGALEHFNENYFPHIWKDPKAAADAFVLASGTRPLMGGKSFLKQRSIPTIEDGLKLKLVPEMDHPVDLVLLKLMEMRRFRMGHEIVAEMKTSKVIHYVKVGGDIPAGEVKINDPFATVYAPRGTAPYGATIAGHYYAPEPVATVLNNYLSPGLRGNILFRGPMALGNVLNQAQLGISAFHLGFTSLDAIVSKTALGLEQLAAGRPLDAMKSAGAAIATPLTNFFQGRRLRRALLVPGSEGAEFAKIAEGYISGGGRISMSKVYKNNSIEKLMQAVRRKEIGAAAFQAIPAALQAASYPLMEWIVPAQKMGVAADLIRFELSRMPAGATVDEVRGVMRKVTESVDNRMGQMVYDNLFWNKVVKDMAMVSVRSVGWNLGTIRELGGGAKDFVTAPARIAQVIKGTSPITERILTHRMAYVAMLPVTVGLMGAVATYFYTGEAPKELKDYFFPRNGRTDDMGNPERVSLPSYIKDVYAYSSHPGRTIENKLHPLLAIVSDMIHNEDYFGDQIRNVDDPVMQKIIQETEFFLKEVMPFGIQNIKEERRRTGHISVAPLFGLTPASRELVRTPAQNTMSRLNSAGAGGLTPEQREISQARTDVYRQVERGAMDEGTALKLLVGTGLKPGDAISQLKQHRQEQMVQSFKRLSLPNAEKVFAQGMPWEQVIWKPVLDKKRYDDARARSIPTPTGVTYSIPQ